MARGALYAHRNGVPVVVSAGNQLSAEDLPPVVRDLVDVSDNSSDRWEVMPAVLPTTISVGAVNMNLDHVEMVGDTVDIWAPIRSAYLAPQDVNNIASALVVNELGGTSGAAPYITGVIAMMQAINPSLDPNTPGLTDEDRRDIVERIRAILTAGASSFSNAELVALGYGNQPERRVLVDPLAAVQAAAIQADPAADFAAAGYDTSLNFNEASAPNDRPRDAIPLGFGAAETGTIVTIPGDGIPGPAPDEDWYTFSMPGDPNPNRIFETTVTLQHPPDPRGDIILIDSARFKLESRGPVSTYRVLGQAGEALPFRVRATPGGDNVYRLEVAAPAPALPEVAITAPLPGDTLCAGRAIDFTADVGFPRFPEISVAPSEIVWRRDGVVLGSGPAVSATLPAGRYAIEVTAFADARASSRIMIEVEDCPGAAPQPTITRPSADTTTGDNAFAYDGYDRARGMWFTEVSLAGSASDAEDGAIPDGSLVWTTDRSDLQVAALGTGSRITARLYSDTCTGTWHELTLSATDSDGNTRSARRRIFIWTLC